MPMPGGFDSFDSLQSAANTATATANSYLSTMSLRTGKKPRPVQVAYAAPGNPREIAMSDDPRRLSNTDRLRNWQWSDELGPALPSTVPKGRAGLKAKYGSAAHRAREEQALANQALALQEREARASGSGSRVASPVGVLGGVQEPQAAYTASAHSSHRSAHSRSSNNASRGSRPASRPAQVVGQPNVIDFADRYPTPHPQYAGNVSFGRTNRRRKGCLRSLFCCL